MRVGYDYEAEYRRLGIGKPPCCQSRVGRITSSLGRTRDRRVQRGSEKREIDGQGPCRQLSSERPTELALLSQVVRTESFAESLQNCSIVLKIRKERHTHGLQVHCRLAGRRQCTN